MTLPGWKVREALPPALSTPRRNIFVEWCAVIVEKVKDTRAPFYRPAIPKEESEGIHPDILTLMKQCWAEEPARRHSYDEIAKALRTINKGKLALFITIMQLDAFLHSFVLWPKFVYL